MASNKSLTLNLKIPKLPTNQPWARQCNQPERFTPDSALNKADAKEKNNKKKSATAKKKTTSLPAATIEAMRKKVMLFNQMERERDALQVRVNSLEEELSEKIQHIALLHQAGNDSKKQAEVKDKEIQQLKQQLLTSQSAIKKAGGVDESQLNEDLLQHVENATKSYLWRTWKFLEDEEDLEKATQEVLLYLPVDTNLPEDEFVRLYKRKVNQVLTNMRTYTQSEAKKRMYGT